MPDSGSGPVVSEAMKDAAAAKLAWWWRMAHDDDGIESETSYWTEPAFFALVAALSVDLERDRLLKEEDRLIDEVHRYADRNDRLEEERDRLVEAAEKLCRQSEMLASFVKSGYGVDVLPGQATVVKSAIHAVREALSSSPSEPRWDRLVEEKMFAAFCAGFEATEPGWNGDLFEPVATDPTLQQELRDAFNYWREALSSSPTEER